MPKKPKYNEVTCPRCKEPMAVGAEICPHCRTEFSPDDVSKRVKQHKRGISAGCGCLILIVVGIAGASAIGSGDGGKSKKDWPKSSITAPAENQNQDVTPKAGSASAQVKGAVITFHNDTFASLQACDEAGKRTASFAKRMQAGAGSLYDGYSVAKAQVEACRESSADVRRVDIPAALPGPAHDEAEKTQETCENAAVFKQMAAQTMMEIFDGDMKPSKVDEMKEQANTAQAGTLACAAGVMTVALKAGVDLKDLPSVK